MAIAPRTLHLPGAPLTTATASRRDGGLCPSERAYEVVYKTHCFERLRASGRRRLRLDERPRELGHDEPGAQLLLDTLDSKRDDDGERTGRGRGIGEVRQDGDSLAGDVG